ncbi:RNA methyltransferase, putative [Plasmodium relictum]|uniref:RNA methyltransferase, putative n=1 Tax=Plasmodium relictum TaxID=85471 RepID=A0A1J1HD26_PLARL|nr:RNA methyltransferase, putative [Plasmodium relictum]CRH03827.1 RNA methyltransferase, putative [Plasmodium relictum]
MKEQEISHDEKIGKKYIYKKMNKKQMNKKKKEIVKKCNKVKKNENIVFETNDSNIIKNNNLDEIKNDINECIKDAIPKRIPNISRDLKIDLFVAIPSTIINNKSDVIKSYLSSYLARIFTIFSISKIYIYDDQLRNENAIKAQKNDFINENSYKRNENKNNNDKNEEKNNRKYNNNNQGSNNDSINETIKKKSYEYSYLCKYLHYNLQYLETPQYLRKHLFPITNFLKNSGIMNPVDAPHHLRSDEWLPFREGVVIKKESKGIIVDVGLFSNVFIKDENYIDTGTRVTVLLNSDSFQLFQKKNSKILLPGKLIHPTIPKLFNLYWGYSIEILKNVSDIFNLPVDYIIGTSERGNNISDSILSFKNIKSVLIVFGNKDGLENLLIKEKEEEKKKNYSTEKKIKVLNKILKKFDLFINTCPFQTSRTIRTEEAITITLSLLHNILK